MKNMENAENTKGNLLVKRRVMPVGAPDVRPDYLWKQCDYEINKSTRINQQYVHTTQEVGFAVRSCLCSRG